MLFKYSQPLQYIEPYVEQLQYDYLRPFICAYANEDDRSQMESGLNSETKVKTEELMKTERKIRKRNSEENCASVEEDEPERGHSKNGLLEIFRMIRNCLRGSGKTKLLEHGKRSIKEDFAKLINCNNTRAGKNATGSEASTPAPRIGYKNDSDTNPAKEGDEKHLQNSRKLRYLNTNNTFPWDPIFVGSKENPREDVYMKMLSTVAPHNVLLNNYFDVRITGFPVHNFITNNEPHLRVTEAIDFSIRKGLFNIMTEHPKKWAHNMNNGFNNASDASCKEEEYLDRRVLNANYNEHNLMVNTPANNFIVANSVHDNKTNVQNTNSTLAVNDYPNSRRNETPFAAYATTNSNVSIINKSINANVSRRIVEQFDLKDKSKNVADLKFPVLNLNEYINNSKVNLNDVRSEIFKSLNFSMTTAKNLKNVNGLLFNNNLFSGYLWQTIDKFNKNLLSKNTTNNEFKDIRKSGKYTESNLVKALAGSESGSQKFLKNIVVSLTAADEIKVNGTLNFNYADDGPDRPPDNTNSASESTEASGTPSRQEPSVSSNTEGSHKQSSDPCSHDASKDASTVSVSSSDSEHTGQLVYTTCYTINPPDATTKPLLSNLAAKDVNIASLGLFQYNKLMINSAKRSNDIPFKEYNNFHNIATKELRLSKEAAATTEGPTPKQCYSHVTYEDPPNPADEGVREFNWSTVVYKNEMDYEDDYALNTCHTTMARPLTIII